MKVEKLTKHIEANHEGLVTGKELLYNGLDVKEMEIDNLKEFFSHKKDIYKNKTAFPQEALEYKNSLPLELEKMTLQR